MNDIVLWYDDIQKSNCEFNNATYLTRTILDKLKINFINYEIKITDQTINDIDSNFYIIELCNVNHEFDIFSLIPNHTKNLFSKGLKIILYYPREGHELGEWFLKIYQRLIKNNLINFKIYFIFGDIDFKTNYELFLLKYNIKSFLTPITIDYFASDYLEKVDIFNQSLETDRPYDYLFYNGKIRPHRLYAVSELKRKNIFNQGIVSLTATTHTGESFTIEDCVNIFKSYDIFSKNLENFVNDFEPIIVDLRSDDFLQENINFTTIDHYKKTYFSVVSETNITTRFITEKIYKPIYNLHPFIILGAPRILEYLKLNGFKTFDNFFDESYDQELDNIKRINMVIFEIENFVKKSKREKQILFEKNIDKLLYNRNHFIKNTNETKRNEFLKIFQRKNNEN